MAAIGILSVSLLFLSADLSLQQEPLLSDVIKSHPQLTKFTAMIERTNALGTFSWNTVNLARTCYAPVNSAWDAVPSLNDTQMARILPNHFMSDRKWTWAQMEAAKSDMNLTTGTAIGDSKKLLFHEEHNNYFVSGCMFVTNNHTDPSVNEIVAERATLFLIDCAITSEGHTDNFFVHMNRDESRASKFAALVEHYANTSIEGKQFVEKLKLTVGTLLVPKASILSSPFVVPELETLKADTPKLKEVLESHLIENNFIFTRYFHEEVTWQTLSKPFISHAADPIKHPGVDRLLEGGGVMAELKDADANITMSNGVMHFIDALLHFKFTAYTLIGTNRVIDMSDTSSESSTGGLFMTAIQKIQSVRNMLQSPAETLTVFAPTHVATGNSEHFKKLIDEVSTTASQSEQDASSLAKLLNSCIVRKKLSLVELRSGVNELTLNGTNLVSREIGSDVIVEVDGVMARIVESNAGIEASNGVVHVIDKVLALKGTNIWERMTQPSFDNQLSKFNRLLQDSGLHEVLSDPNRVLTVFAPLNSAFDQTQREFANTEPSFEDFLTLDKYEAGRKIFLQRHIVPNKTKIAVDSSKMMLQTLNDNEQLHVGHSGAGIRVTYKSVGGALLGPFPAAEADNGYFYRVQGGCLYSKEDPRIGQVGTGAAALSMSLLLTMLCVLLAAWKL